MRQTDELRSIARFIDGTLALHPNPKPIIYRERPAGTYVRPAFKIDNPTGVRVPATNTFQFDERTWMITFYAKTRPEAMRWGEGWVDKLTRNADPKSRMVIPLWIFDFPYYAPLVREKTVSPSTTFGAGTYSVQIVAENLIGQLTFASSTSAVTIAAGKAIEIQVPLEPKGWPIGKKFHLYLSGTGLGAAHRIAEVTYQGNMDPVFVAISDTPGGTPSTPVVGGQTAPALLSGMPTETAVRYRYMRVMEEPQTENMEDPQERALWNHIVRLRTQTIGPREYSHDQLLGQVTPTIIVQVA